MALRCPRLFHFRYVDKVKEPEVMPETRLGKAIHHALELVLQGTQIAVAIEQIRAELPTEHEQQRFDRLGASIAPFSDRISQFRRRRRVTRQLVEYSLAVREDLSATQFYSGDAYYRGVLDLGYVFSDESQAPPPGRPTQLEDSGDVQGSPGRTAYPRDGGGQSLALVDHKTGARTAGTSIADQLAGYAVLAAAAFRHVRTFWLGIHWVAQRAVEWNAPVKPDAIVDRLVPDLLDNIEAAALAVDDGPRPNPGPWCDRCSYRAVCPASRELRYEPVEWYQDEDD